MGESKFRRETGVERRMKEGQRLMVLGCDIKFDIGR